MLILDREDVESLLDPTLLVNALASAMVEVSNGAASMAPRTITLVPDHGGLLGAMAAYVPGHSILAAKLVSVYPLNAERGLPSHQAIVVAFDPETGELVACMDGTSITALRTAAGSALATRYLARDDSSVLSVIGAGVQAETHARALVGIRTFKDVLVWNRTRERADQFASRMSGVLGVQVLAVTLEEALSSADVLVSATHAEDPVILRDHLRPGVHLNAVGLNLDGREVEAEVVRDATVVVESRAAALAPASSGGANDLTWAIRDGLLESEHVAEIGEVISGARPGRTATDDITFYRSVGISVQDAVAASLVVAAARAAGR